VQQATDDASTSKIGVPALPGWVIPRPRLTARIGKGVRGPLTVVTGPPGAGKTLAVASWITSLDSMASVDSMASLDSTGGTASLEKTFHRRGEDQGKHGRLGDGR